METDYDLKFDDMKKYIPFLENMIKKLESSSTGSANPRQAQLSKIKALRDLLLDKNKRMKMENLQKCEQVLINLYAKVESKDSLPGIQMAPGSVTVSPRDEKSPINSARRKLKDVDLTHSALDDTLPEIARANPAEGECTPGSKEPALFQRRPNNPGVSPNSPSYNSKRSYTRILLSPPAKNCTQNWSPSKKVTGCPLYQRSPRKSPYKKERKKSRKDLNRSRKNTDSNLNITLKVPQERLDSLQTDDLMNRIINCDNTDVDIGTLRDLRSQILGELKQTGANEDISDILLNFNQNNTEEPNVKVDVEEGELSESENETEQNVFGGLIFVNDDKIALGTGLTPLVKNASNNAEQRKIQIRLVVSDNDQRSKRKEKSTPEPGEPNLFKKEITEKTNKTEHFKDTVLKLKPKLFESPFNNFDLSSDYYSKPETSEKDFKEKIEFKAVMIDEAYVEHSGDKKKSIVEQIDIHKTDIIEPNTNLSKIDGKVITQNENKLLDKAENKANFYTPLAAPESSVTIANIVLRKETRDIENSHDSSPVQPQIPFLSDSSTSEVPKIPVGDKKISVTEIDILQALKNEILSETIAIPGADNVTPTLHQPKILTKVTNAQNIAIKKKISLENYKKKTMQKSAPLIEPKIFISKPNDDAPLKPSRGLTAKEFERFNLAGFPIDSDSSDDDIENNSIHVCLDPKSPEYEVLSEKGSESPVIIPEEPLKLQTVPKGDVDMRVISAIIPDTKSLESMINVPKDFKLSNECNQFRPVDPRIRKDIEVSSLNLSGIYRSPLNVPNMTPSRTPNMTPSKISNMTPNTRTFDLTPSRNIDFDEQISNKKHVYAPLVPPLDNCEGENSMPKDGINLRSDSTAIPNNSATLGSANSSRRSNNNRNPQISRDETVDPRINRDQYQKPRDPRLNHERRDGALDYPSTANHYYGRGNPNTPSRPFGRSDGSKTSLHPFARSVSEVSSSLYGGGDSTPSHSFVRSDISKTASHQFSRSDYSGTPSHSYGRSDCPSTPSHPFGRSDCPNTPSHPFGRSDCPNTPSHPFGRSDCPNTPSHPFGRSDCPNTPSHPFGRSDCPNTPSHPFGRSDCPNTPSHPFGRSDCPNTPSHHFGRSDCPNTPSHTFGRSDCPNTPSHPFGRSDCPNTPSHPFGRSECPPTPGHPFGRGGYQQDSKRGRKSYSELDDDRSYYKDRSSSYNSKKYYDKYDRSYLGSADSFQRYGSERNVGRIEHSRFLREKSIPRDDNRFTRDTSVGKRYKEQLYRREPSVSQVEESNPRNMSKEFRPGAGTSSDASNRTDRRTMPGERGFNQLSRDGITYDEAIEKTVSIESHAGRSFTIDTSINTTFQAIKSDNVDKLFDERKNRSSSVGRTVHGDNNERSILPEVITQLKINRNRSNFMRAKSVGRDLAEATPEKTFKDIKADFELFKSTTLKPKSPKGNDDCKKINAKSTITEKNSVNNKQIGQNVKMLGYEAPKPQRPIKNARSRRAQFDKQKQNCAYSPRKNTKDPRIHRDNASPSIKSIESYSHDNRKSEQDKRNSIMVYTNDNIAKGNVLGPGAGVKNYKIPKIKRQPEENLEKCSDDSTSQTFEELKKDKISQEMTSSETDTKDNKKDKSSSSKASKSKMDINKISKSDKKSKSKFSLLSSDDEPSSPVRTYKTRKAVVQDSDSVSEIKSKVTEMKEKDEIVKDVEIKTNLTSENIENSDILDFSFDMQDTDMDNVSDTEIDNISDLIADLDKDIDPTKSSSALMADLTKNDIFDNILKSLGDIDSKASISNDIQESSVKNETKNKDFKLNETDQNSKYKENQIKAVVDEQESTQTQQSDSIASTQEDEHSVVGSTSIMEECNDNKLEANFDEKSKPRSEACSTPDSTINTEDTAYVARPSQDPPDSTNQPQIDMHSDITSTHDPTEHFFKDVDVVEDSSEPVVPKVNSLDTILSILKDKSKIKELLGMLDDQIDNEKLKKKLEKLSEIVSDDEDKTVDSQKDKTGNADVIVNETNEVIDKCEKIEETIEKTTVSEVMKNDNSEEIKELINDISGKDNDSKPEDINTQKTIVEDILDKNYDVDDKILSEKEEEQKSVNVPPSDEDNLPIKLRSKRIVKPVKKSSCASKPKNKRGKQSKTTVKKRITRSVVQQNEPPKSDVPTKKNRVHRTELHKLQEDIRDMFISNEVLNATGIRMCRLAKLVEDKNTKNNSTDTSPTKTNESSNKTDTEDEEKRIPNKVLETNPKPQGKKRGRKPKLVKPAVVKPEENITEMAKPNQKQKPGPKSKTRPQIQDDPYEFESDSVSEATSKFSEKASDNSDSDSESVDSSRSFNNSDSLLVELKPKAKRKRGSWKLGVIKTKKKKIPAPKIVPEISVDKEASPEPLKLIIEKPLQVPDMNCFIDKNYCFQKGINEYSCRLCPYEGEAIVHHYKKQHPHYEIPLSRMSPHIAKEAINQSMITNFQEVSKVVVTKFVCRFCSMTFDDKRTVILEAFFWHVVSTHTGEYKQLCSECTYVKSCTFMLDIPPPPKDLKSLLMGYICGKCNYTQVSLENLKNHVSLRHNDEETEVYSISLSVMTKKTLDALKMRSVEHAPRTLRSRRSNNSSTTEEVNAANEDGEKTSDLEGEETLDTIASKPIAPLSMQSRINFESDDFETDHSESAVKIETDDDQGYRAKVLGHSPNKNISEIEDQSTDLVPENKALDVFVEPHFKIKYTESGTKEYLCCINGDDHYTTTLLISMKKHVQFKHSTDSWDGYCSVCKVIVMPQGLHKFKDCLAHLLDNHMDSFPVLQNIITPPVQEERSTMNRAESPKTYLNVRPISELLTGVAAQSNNAVVTQDSSNALPKIANVVSLNREVVINQLTTEPPLSSPVSMQTEGAIMPKVVLDIKYEEAQKQVMHKKHVIVLQTMMSPEKLAHIFKCAGQYCSFTCSSVENAFLHTSTHQRVGGTDALSCSYCSFDASGNAIDLVTHVFKEHGSSKYACMSCFYRAFSSPMVEAHYLRAHGPLKEGVVLLSPVHTPAPTAEDLMTRQEAVKHYVCSSDQANCKFKTYTMMKFLQHFEDKHPNVSSHPCNECSHVSADPNELIRHLKTHHLKLYQCTWCIHGADTEQEMLEHASISHPTKRAQAYLRHILETRDGSATPKFKVLPFIHITKKDTTMPVPVASSAQSENAVREAERALELEELIGQTSTMIAELESSKQDTIQAKVMMIEPEQPTEMPIEMPRVATPPPTDLPIAEQVTPKLKIEPSKETSEKKAAVICLDSDEEEATCLPPPAVIDLSNDLDLVKRQSAPSPNVAEAESTLSASTQRFPWPRLFKCANCKILFKTSNGLRRHFYTCYPRETDVVSCAHCPATWRGEHRLVIEHYTRIHGPANTYTCALCNQRHTSPKDIKKHFADVHNLHKVSFKLKVGSEQPGQLDYLVETSCDSEKQQRGRRKRSLKEPPAAAAPPPAKLRRYGPTDLTALPINQIFDEPAQCSLCEFSTKVRQNMLRHLQMHAEHQAVPQIAPVNPVPHLETNEMHFDRMVNLASSSGSVHRAEPAAGTSAGAGTTVGATQPAQLGTARYPRYVPERQRYACGAKDCSYISIDEDMLKYHWETLHSTTNDFRCVHCPSNQQLDTSRPLTSSRILAHLKMHDAKLFACSSCSFYHHQQQVLEKHSVDKHSGAGQYRLIRGATTAASPSPAPTPGPNAPAPLPAAPTMDLKLWQCGLCKFKSMLRQEVVEHCSKTHQSKFQYKCAFCPWRSSVYENVTKHQTNSHAGQRGDIIYFYYQEGTIPNEPDGTPRWMKQLQRLLPEHEVKTEIANMGVATLSSPVANQPAPLIDLDIVKSEALESAPSPSIEDLCKQFGEFCDPSGLKYKCSLCKIALDDTKEAMQSHLYEELKYRKWGCRVCAYKAFHKAGLQQHAIREHGQVLEPIELSSKRRVEAWVAASLRHQQNIIQENIDNLRLQKIQDPEKPPATEAGAAPAPQEEEAKKPTMQELEKAFGSFGAPVNMLFACPKCDYKVKEEDKMLEHLESELSKVRWSCSACTDSFFQHYHSAQLHCKSAHPGLAARAQEAVREPTTRAAWLAAVLQVQKLSMNYMPVTALPAPASAALVHETDETAADNSLLVVRFERNVPTPEESVRSVVAEAGEAPVAVKRKRPTYLGEADSDEERLVIDELSKKPEPVLQCPYCDLVFNHKNKLYDHLLKHYNLKPYSCGYCDYNAYNATLAKHQEREHPGLKRQMYKTKIPDHPPTSDNPLPIPFLPLQERAVGSPDTVITCLHCVKNIPDTDKDIHHQAVHPLKKLQYIKNGDKFFKCFYCDTFVTEMNDLEDHHRLTHYSHLELKHVTHEARYINQQSYLCKTPKCRRRFKTMESLKIHHHALHGYSPLKFDTLTSNVVFKSVMILEEDAQPSGGPVAAKPESEPELEKKPEPEPGPSGVKRRSDDVTTLPLKRHAKKSTTKLPYVNKVAKKSTSKLPIDVQDSDSKMENQDFSFYDATGKPKPPSV